MAVFTIVALRLIGLWLIANWAASLVTNIAALLGLFGGDRFISSVLVVANSIPILLGALLLGFAPRFAGMILPRDALEENSPSTVSEQAFTRIGLFLIGTLVLTETIPRFIGFATATEEPYWIAPIEEWISLAIGLLLVFGSGLLAGLIGRLRQWSASPTQREMDT